MNTAILSFDISLKKWVAKFQGEIISKGNSREYVIQAVESKTHRNILKLGVTKIVDENSGSLHFDNLPEDENFAQPMPASKFTIDERFEFVEEATQMIVDGNIVSSILCGEGGLGKSYTIQKVLKQNGLLDIQKCQQEAELSEPEEPKAPKKLKKSATPAEVEAYDEAMEDYDEAMEDYEIAKAKFASYKPTINGDYIFVKGYSTAKGLYRTLWENNGKIIIFDDCDSVQKNDVAINLLKSALDSYDERMVTWNSEMPVTDLPKNFLFTGKVIFISNWQLIDVAQPLRSRSISIDLSMTLDQKLERMQTIIDGGDFLPEIDKEYQQDALELIKEVKHSVKELSLRSLISVSKIRAGDKRNWKKFAEYTLSN